MLLLDILACITISYLWLVYWWLLVIILLMVIGAYSINVYIFY